MTTQIRKEKIMENNNNSEKAFAYFVDKFKNIMNWVKFDGIRAEFSYEGVPIDISLNIYFVLHDGQRLEYKILKNETEGGTFKCKPELRQDLQFMIGIIDADKYVAMITVGDDIFYYHYGLVEKESNPSKILIKGATTDNYYFFYLNSIDNENNIHFSERKSKYCNKIHDYKKSLMEKNYDVLLNFEKNIREVM